MAAPCHWPLKDHLLEAGKARERPTQRHSRRLKWSRLFQSDQSEPLLTDLTELAAAGKGCHGHSPKQAGLKQPLNDSLKGLALPLRKGEVVPNEDDGNEYSILQPYLDFPLTVGVAIHRRQYTFFLSSINDICKG